VNLSSHPMPGQNGSPRPRFLTITIEETFRYIAADGLAGVGFPLTPALSPWERESPHTALARSSGLRFAGRLATIRPLPKGEGRGEGEQAERPDTTSDVSKLVYRGAGLRTKRVLSPLLGLSFFTMLLVLVAPASWAAANDIIFADFEGTNYGVWKVTGDAFGRGPARGTLPGQMAVSGFQGKGLVNSFNKGDGATGTLNSPDFTIERKFISFLIGGGGFAGKTCMNLLVGGKVVRTATGPNTDPGGSEQLSASSWDVAEFIGKTARIEIVDQATGGWGHINVDQIVFTDRKPPSLIRNAERELVLEQKLLNFPVKKGAPKRRVALLVGGDVVREFEIELAPG